LASIKNDIVSAPDLWDSIDRETDALKECDEEIEQSEGNEAKIDDRSRQEY
jgi:hypothetical protein